MAEQIYFYDGTWQGVMSVYQDIISGILPEGSIVKEKNEEPQDDLFSEKRFIDADTEKFTMLKDRFIKTAGSDNYDMMCWAFLSEKRGIEDCIFAFMKFAFQAGVEAGSYLSDVVVMKVYSAAQQVRRENHRFKGFLRFEEIKPGMFYAGIEPDYNIIMLLAPHFRRRLSSQDWIIHDKKRNTAVFYDRLNCIHREILSFELPDDSKEEVEYKAMWMKYFNAMGIKERINPRLQRQFAPVKYRKNMFEFGQTGK